MKEKNVYSDFGLEYYAQQAYKDSMQTFLEQLDWSKIGNNIKVNVDKLLSVGKLVVNLPENLTKLADKIEDKDIANKLVTLKDKYGDVLAKIPVKEISVSADKIAKVAPYIVIIALIVEISSAIESVGEKIDDVLKGQMDDREAKCIAAFESYTILKINTQKNNQEDLQRECYIKMQEGLVQTHFAIDRMYQKICLFPQMDKELIIQSIRNVFVDVVGKQIQTITEFIYALLRYKQLLLSAELILIEQNPTDESVKNLHNQKFNNLMDRVINNANIKHVIEYYKEDIPQIYEIWISQIYKL